MNPDRVAAIVDELQEDVEHYLHEADSAEVAGKTLQAYTERQWAYATYAARKKIRDALVPRDVPDDVLDRPRPHLRIAE